MKKIVESKFILVRLGYKQNLSPMCWCVDGFFESFTPYGKMKGKGSDLNT